MYYLSVEELELIHASYQICDFQQVFQVLELVILVLSLPERIVLWILVKIVVGHSLVQTGLLFRFWLCEHCAAGFG
jgi:hypothetical protein